MDTKDIKTTNYNEIEKEFSRLLHDEKNRWIEMYRLLVVVEKNALWKAAGQRSFTAWVKEIAIKNKVHESVIWQRKKAGAVFSDYVARIEMRGEVPPDPIATAIPSESLELISKIGKNNPDIIDDLITKSIQGTMTRDDLRQAWQSSRADQAARADKNDVKNSDEGGLKKNSMPARVIEEQAATATNIVTALIESKGGWIIKPDQNQTDHADHAQRRIGATAPKFRVLTEFAVKTGSSRSARRIDALIIENMTTEGNNYELRLHNIEIKTSEGDLRHDHKSTEYADFVDYSWFAIPSNLVEIAREVKPDQFGILLISAEGTCEIIEPATHVPGIAKLDTLQTALIKLL